MRGFTLNLSRSPLCRGAGKIPAPCRVSVHRVTLASPKRLYSLRESPPPSMGACLRSRTLVPLPGQNRSTFGCSGSALAAERQLNGVKENKSTNFDFSTIFDFDPISFLERRGVQGGKPCVQTFVFNPVSGGVSIRTMARRQRGADVSLSFPLAA